MDLKERILAYMHEEAYRPLPAEELADGMQLTPEDLVQFDAALEELEKEGAILKNRSDLYGIPSRMHLVVGRLSMTAKGFGFIIPDVRDSEEETDVFVPGADLNTAMHGDRVVARVTPAQEEGRSREGEIIRILERANEKIVGTFESSKTFGFVTPDNTKLSQDIFVPKKAFHGAKTGSKVVVEITKWPDRRRNAEGKVIEVLGKVGDPGVDVLSVMRQYDLSGACGGGRSTAAGEGGGQNQGCGGKRKKLFAAHRSNTSKNQNFRWVGASSSCGGGSHKNCPKRSLPSGNEMRDISRSGNQWRLWCGQRRAAGCRRSHPDH